MCFMEINKFDNCNCYYSRVVSMEEKKIDERQQKLEDRLEKLKSLEDEIKKKEKAIKQAEGAKKQVPLRLSASLYNEIAKWAEDDFRSINGQIEYLLTEAIRKRGK